MTKPKTSKELWVNLYDDRVKHTPSRPFAGLLAWASPELANRGIHNTRPSFGKPVLRVHVKLNRAVTLEGDRKWLPRNRWP